HTRSYGDWSSDVCSSDLDQNVGPAITAPPTGCVRNSNEVTTPKLPPPPRSAQNSSGCSFALACARDPSARTTSAPSRLSIVRPRSEERRVGKECRGRGGE